MPTQNRVAAGAWLRDHLGDPLYRTGYYLILGTGITALLGVAFWALAAHSYSARVVGLNAAAISAMTLVSGVCSLGLSAVLVRYLPVAGGSTRLLVVRSYAVTAMLSLVVGAAAALTSQIWSPSLSFLAEPAWLVGFAAAAAGTTVFTLQDSVLTGLRAAKWVPLENSLYSLAKLLLLVATAAALPMAGPFVAWNAPLLVAIVLVNFLIFRSLIPVASRAAGTLSRQQLLSMAPGNYAGKLFTLGATLYVPILVANIVGPAEAAYFFVPWMISLGLELIALNMTTSLTVEAAIDLPALRRLTRRTFVHSMRLVAPAAAFVALTAPWLLLVFGQDYADAGASVLRLLALGMIPNVVVALGIGVARLEHKGWIVVAVQGAQCVLLLGLGALLLPSMGIEAIGVVWTGTQALLALALLGGILRPLLLPSRR